MRRQRDFRLKQICANAVLAVQIHSASGLGAYDRRPGLDALSSMTGHGRLASPVEWPSYALCRLKVSTALHRTSKIGRGNTVKCLFFAHPDDDEAMWVATG